VTASRVAQRKKSWQNEQPRTVMAIITLANNRNGAACGVARKSLYQPKNQTPETPWRQ